MASPVLLDVAALLLPIPGEEQFARRNKGKRRRLPEQARCQRGIGNSAAKKCKLVRGVVYFVCA